VERVDDRTTTLDHVRITGNLADMFIKGLPAMLFEVVQWHRGYASTDRSKDCWTGLAVSVYISALLHSDHAPSTRVYLLFVLLLCSTYLIQRVSHRNKTHGI
jgi:hypothetical protein